MDVHHIISNELIELAKEDDIHLLCLPSHTTQILQPLDVEFFNLFKRNLLKSCSKYLGKHPGVVETPDALASWWQELGQRHLLL